jgi:hypothetical protein
LRIFPKVYPLRSQIRGAQQQLQFPPKVGRTQQQWAGSGKFRARFDQHHRRSRRQRCEKFIDALRLKFDPAV